MQLSYSIAINITMNMPIKSMANCFTYLGLDIPRNPKLLFKLNLFEAHTKLKKNMVHGKDDEELALF